MVSVYFWAEPECPLSILSLGSRYRIPPLSLPSPYFLFCCCLMTLGTFVLGTNELEKKLTDGGTSRTAAPSSSSHDLTLTSVLRFIFQKRRLISWIHWFASVNHCLMRSFDFHLSSHRGMFIQICTIRGYRAQIRRRGARCGNAVSHPVEFSSVNVAGAQLPIVTVLGLEGR